MINKNDICMMMLLLLDYSDNYLYNTYMYVNVLTKIELCLDIFDLVKNSYIITI